MSDYQYPHLEQTLPGFHDARGLIKEKGSAMSAVNMRGDKFDFYRFTNRLRLAINFREVIIEEYDQPTVDGYGALTKLFLTWSTFEMYCELCGKKYHEMFHNYPKRHTHELANAYWDYDSQGVLIDFLIDQTEIHGQNYYLKQFDEGNNLRVITVAACMRHIYAHGHLTANPQGLTAEETSKICNLFTDFIHTFIRADFQRRVAVAKNSE